MNGLNAAQPSYETNISEIFMPITIASIMNLMGPDMMVILLIVLLLFGAKNCLNSLEEWVGRSRSLAPHEMRLRGNSVSPARTA